MADFVVFFIIAVIAVFGYKNGLIKSVFNLGYHIVALIAAAIFYPVVSEKLTNTALYQKVYDAVSNKISQGGFVNIDSMPEFLKSTAQNGVNAAADSAATTVTQLFVTIIAVVIVFFGVKILLNILSKVFNGFAKLPVIKSVNKLGGFVFGILSGIIVVYVLLAVVSMFPGSETVKYIEQSFLAKSMYDNNIIIKCIFKI